jgi:hypothetical protein
MERPGWGQGQAGNDRHRDVRPFQGGGSQCARMGLGAILAGETMVRRVAQVGGRVSHHIRAKIGAAGIVPRSGRFVRPDVVVVVHALDQYRGQDVNQCQPPTLSSHLGSPIRFMMWGKRLEIS